jgi:hypothetical protein
MAEDRTERHLSDAVDNMSAEARVELARDIAGREVFRPNPVRRPSEGPDPATEALAVRVAAELHQTERRLDRIERSLSRGRYQTGSGGAPSGRYARLLRRADRLERQLRSLR